MRKLSCVMGSSSSRPSLGTDCVCHERVENDHSDGPLVPRPSPGTLHEPRLSSLIDVQNETELQLRGKQGNEGAVSIRKGDHSPSEQSSFSESTSLSSDCNDSSRRTSCEDGFGLDVALLQLEELITRLENKNFTVPKLMDKLELLNKLTKSGLLFLQSTYKAVQEEEIRRPTDAQEDVYLSLIEGMENQHEIEVTNLESKLLAAADEREVILEDYQAAKSRNLCQICVQNERDVVVLNCMHNLYCTRCLEIQRQSDGAG